MINFTECSNRLPRDFALVVMQGKDLGVRIGSIRDGEWRVHTPLFDEVTGKNIMVTGYPNPERWCYVFPQDDEPEQDDDKSELARIKQVWNEGLEKWYENHDSMPAAFVKLALAMAFPSKTKQEVEYRILGKGETIQEGDEYDSCVDNWRDTARWEPAPIHMIGRQVSDPSCVAHTKYRRKVAVKGKDYIILPCPFCGEIPSHYIEDAGHGYIGGHFEICCMNDVCPVGPCLTEKHRTDIPGMTKQETIDSIWPGIIGKWNNRATK